MTPTRFEDSTMDGSTPTSSASGSTSGSGTPPTTSAASASDPALAVSAVSGPVKLPPFWPADPQLWFAQVEAQFACRRITSQQSRFDHVVSSLSPEYAAEVRDLLIKPPTDNPYNTLKEQLTKRTTASEQRKLQLLFTSEQLGDSKPTQLLRRMQQLLGDRPGMMDETLLRELFLQRLPPNVRMVLASTPDGTGLEKLADLADKVMEVATPTVGVASVNAPPTLATEVEHLRVEVSRLGKLVQTLARPRSSSRSAMRPSRRSPTPPARAAGSSDPPQDSDTLCWYHHKFGSQARRCKSPCSWQSNP